LRLSFHARAGILVLLLLLPVTARGATKTWSGAVNNSWSEPGNWFGGRPVDGDDLVFPTEGASTNDIASLAPNAIAIEKPVSLTGNRVVLGRGGLTIHEAAHGSRFALPVTLGADQSWEISALPAVLPTTFLEGAIDLAGHDLTIAVHVDVATDIDESGAIFLTGDVSGRGAFAVRASQVSLVVAGHLANDGPVGFTGVSTSHMVLANTNTFSGPLSIDCEPDGWPGWVEVGAEHAIPDGASVSLMGRDCGFYLGSHAVSLASLNGSGILVFEGGRLTVTGTSTDDTLDAALEGVGDIAITGGRQSWQVRSLLGGEISITDAEFTLVRPEFMVDDDSIPPAGVTLNSGLLVIVDGKVGPLTLNGGMFEPHGLVSAGDMTFAPGSTLHGALSTRGSVSLNGALLFDLGLPPAPGAGASIIRNEGTRPVSGTFVGLPEGAALKSKYATYRITYRGGTTGLDVEALMVSVKTTTILQWASGYTIPMREGNEITLAAKVFSSTTTGIAPGVVEFYDGPTLLGQATLPTSKPERFEPVTFKLPMLAIGTHLLRAVYPGWIGRYEPSASDVITVTIVPRAATSTPLYVNPSPSRFDQPVTLSVSVLGSGNPSGTVTFLDGSKILAVTGLLRSAGTSFLTIASGALAPGTHMLSARYSGDGSFAPSASAEVFHGVQGTEVRTPVVTLVTSPNPASASDTVMTIVTVSGDGPTPSGNITMFDRSASFRVVRLDANGQAIMPMARIQPGMHAFWANYAGDANYAAAKSAVVSQLIVVPTATTIFLTADPNPASASDRITFTAAVNATAGAPSGTVRFTDAGVTIADVPLDASGRASVTLTLDAGTHAIRAEYLGTVDFLPTSSNVLFEVVAPPVARMDNHLHPSRLVCVPRGSATC
jgi:hypothetical protein